MPIRGDICSFAARRWAVAQATSAPDYYSLISYRPSAKEVQSAIWKRQRGHAACCWEASWYIGAQDVLQCARACYRTGDRCALASHKSSCSKFAIFRSQFGGAAEAKEEKERLTTMIVPIHCTTTCKAADP